MKVIIGSDHAGFRLKEKFRNYLNKNGHSVMDVGAKRLVKTDDYPDYGAKVASRVSKDKNAMGILFCGSAEGMCIVANKFRNVRAVAVRTKALAKLSREHNDSNVLCLAGGDSLKKQASVPFEKAKDIVDVWLNTPFSEEPRHARRLEKISKIERKR